MNIIDTLKALAASLFPDNIKNQIKPADVRQMFEDLLDDLNQDNNFNVPAAAEVVTVTPAKLNTTVRFKGVIADDFTLNIVGGADLIPGKSTLTIIWGGDGSTSAKVVTYSGNIQAMGCGAIQTTFTTPAFTVVSVLVWDGVNFTGTDNC